MPLILANSFDEHSRAEIEAHLEEVRARRLVAAVEYQEGMKNKFLQEADKIRRRMQAEYKMLGKELARLEKAEDVVNKRLSRLNMLLSEHGLILESADV